VRSDDMEPPAREEEAAANDPRNVALTWVELEVAVSNFTASVGPHLVA
jgi:hypothetical protein